MIIVGEDKLGFKIRCKLKPKKNDNEKDRIKFDENDKVTKHA